MLWKRVISLGAEKEKKGQLEGIIWKALLKGHGKHIFLMQML